MTPGLVVDRPEARSLPSRHRFALARLIAYARLRGAAGAIDEVEHLILPVERDQTASEINGVALWVFLTTACYLAATLPVVLPLAIAIAIPLAAILLQLPIVIGGPILRALTGDGNHIKIVAVITMVLLMLASSWIATTATWARYVAWLFFAVVFLNALAAVIERLLRRSIAEAEERCVR